MIEPDSAKQMMLVTGHGAHEKEFYRLLSLLNYCQFAMRYALCQKVSNNRQPITGIRQPHYFPPNASSEMSTAALFVAKMAFILPRVTGKTLVVKNSRLFSCPS
jgi:hypothetical protein